MLEQPSTRARILLTLFSSLALFTVAACSSEPSKASDKSPVGESDDDSDDDDGDVGDDDDGDVMADAGKATDAGKKGDGGSASGSAKDSGSPPAKDAGAKDAAPGALKDGAPPTSGDPSTPRGSETCLKPGNGQFTEPGPYQVATKTVDLGMIEATQHTGEFTIFYPNPLEESCPHPIVAWGNGTTVMGSEIYAFFNQNAASWGMVVIASHEDNTGSGNHLKAGIDYLLMQNDDSSSPFYKKLSTRAGTGGHSQGGLGATVAAGHPNVEALVSVAGGGRPKAGVATMCLTGTEDIAEMSCVSEYNGAPGPAFLANWQGGDHFSTETLLGYILGDPGSKQMQRLYAAWFRCFLADDHVACALFEGAPDSCGLCKDTGWAMLESRNFQ